MKDIQYFLSEEEKYLASSQAEPELVWNEELEEFGKNDINLFSW